MARTSVMLAMLMLTGCLGSPEPQTCAELPPGSAGCPSADAAPPDTGPLDAATDAAPADARAGDAAPVDAAPSDGAPDDPDVDRSDAGDMGPPPDASPDMAPDADPCGPEQCNGLDDDCDSIIDEDTDGTACVSGLGACASPGTLRCSEGEPLCDAELVPAQVEACNGRDDDCDGQPDENQLFTSPETEVGPMLALERPAIAAVGEQFAVARRVAADPAADAGATEALALTLFDRQGAALETITQPVAGAVTAFSLLNFGNQGDEGFLLVWGERAVIGADVDETYAIRALIAFPANQRFGDVDGPVTLRETQGPVTALDAVGGEAGIAVAWIVADTPLFGFVDFRVEPPAIAPVGLVGERLQPAFDIAVAEAGGRFFVAYNEGPAAGRVRALQLVRLDSGAGPAQRPTLVAEGNRLASPTVAARPDGVFVAWSELADTEGVRLRVYDVDGASVTNAVAVGSGRRAAVGPRLALNAAEVGIAWTEVQGADAQSAVYFSRLATERGVWRADGDPLRISYGPGRSGPLDLALGDRFGAVWFDGRLGDPSAWLRLGPYTCAADAAVQ